MSSLHIYVYEHNPEAKSKHDLAPTEHIFAYAETFRAPVELMQLLQSQINNPKLWCITMKVKHEGETK